LLSRSPSCDYKYLQLQLVSRRLFASYTSRGVVASRRQQQLVSVIVFEARDWYPNHGEMSSRPRRRRKIAFATIAASANGSRCCILIARDCTRVRAEVYRERNITRASDLKWARRNSPGGSPSCVQTICAHPFSFFSLARTKLVFPCDSREKIWHNFQIFSI